MLVFSISAIPVIPKSVPSVANATLVNLLFQCVNNKFPKEMKKVSGTFRASFLDTRVQIKHVGFAFSENYFPQNSF